MGGNETEMSRETTSLYALPERWVSYGATAILDQLVEARSAAGVLNRLPYLQQWIAQVHEEQLRLEAAGTSRIEGAEFSDQEQEIALASQIPPHVDLTRSQRQLRAADTTYRWLRSQPTGRPITPEFVLDIHRRMVTGCDDDSCEPGALRPTGWNVTFGTPRCRGAEGGNDCQVAFNGLCAAIAGEFRQHDRIVQALAAHYHVGAMHPFGDGNGRTSRALEAFMLRQAGVSHLVQLRSPRRRVLAERQLRILEVLLDSSTPDVTELLQRTAGEYHNLKYPGRARTRDFINLLDIGAIEIDENGIITLNLDWPQQLSESELLHRYENLPSAVSANHPARAALSQLLHRCR